MKQNIITELSNINIDLAYKLGQCRELMEMLLKELRADDKDYVIKTYHTILNIEDQTINRTINYVKKRFNEIFRG